jgi:hypothetical protein
MAESVGAADTGQAPETPAKKPVPKVHARHFWDTMNLGYLGAGVATLITAWESINGYFYANAKEKDEEKFSEVMNRREEELTNRLGQNRLSADATSNLKDLWRNRRVKDEVYKKYNKEIDEAFSGIRYSKEDIGILKKVEEGAKSSLHKLLVIQPHQRKKVYLQVAVVGSIAVGAIYSFARERRYSERLEKQEEKNIELQQSQRGR